MIPIFTYAHNSLMPGRHRDAIRFAAEAYVTARANEELKNSAVSIEPDMVQSANLAVNAETGEHTYHPMMIRNPRAGLLTERQWLDLFAKCDSFLDEFRRLLVDHEPMLVGLTWDPIEKLIRVRVHLSS